MSREQVADPTFDGPGGAFPQAPDPLPAPAVDDHCHLEMARGRDDHRPWDEVLALLDAASAAGVPRVVQIGCELASARWTVDAVDRDPRLLGGVALHPNEAPVLAAAGRLDAAVAEIADLAAHDRIRVIGETGLDYFRTGSEGIAAQQESFRAHIAIAKERGLALQIHDRDAHDDVLRILTEEGAPDRTVFHCFSGDAAMARVCVEAGYVLSFAGTVTFKNAAGLREALALVPLDQVLVETDAPFLTPTPHRGAPNATYLVPHTVRAIADVLDVEVATLCQAVTATAERVYGSW